MLWLDHDTWASEVSLRLIRMSSFSVHLVCVYNRVHFHYLESDFNVESVVFLYSGSELHLVINTPSEVELLHFDSLCPEYNQYPLFQAVVTLLLAIMPGLKFTKR